MKTAKILREKALNIFKQALVGLEASNEQAKFEVLKAQEEANNLMDRLNEVDSKKNEAKGTIKENNKTIEAIKKLGV